jgi:nucleotide-binding universal stress UspA family protein
VQWSIGGRLISIKALDWPPEQWSGHGSVAMKDVMTFIEAGVGSSSHLDAAAAIAKSQDALLTGVCSVGMRPIPGYVAVELGADLLAQLVDGRREQARKLGEEFRAAAARAGVGSAWLSEERDPMQTVLRHGRMADVVILRQAAPEEDGGSSEAGEIVIALGRPVIQIPHAGFPGPIGRRILLAWNGSREATRAMHDAIPLLKTAEAVLAVAINPNAAEAAMEDLLAHLRRHGVEAGLRPLASTGGEITEALLDAAAEFAADFLVMGAYGHSRAREMLLGGATRGVLRQATLPVLFSH